MVSLPDELLVRLDAEAARRRMTRSGLLRDLATTSLRRRGEHRALLAAEVMRDATPHGGEVADVLARHRSR
jgi:metal-responsive CopG/Arc/MetJ family transcriptional regulator